MRASPILRGVIAGALVAAPAIAQQAPRSATTLRSAPIENVRYEVTFDRVTAADRRIRVVTTFDVTGTDPVLLSLPDWTPGAYEMSWFPRWVIGFAASADGKPLEWDKLDFDTWRIRAGGAKAVRVTFDYRADSLDNAMAWTRADFALFNGTNLFLYAEGRPLDFTARVSVNTDPSWLVATGMQAVAGSPHTYTASNYHDLVDMPFFVGRFDLDSARVVDRWVRLATYPAGSVSGGARDQAWDQLKRAIPPEAAVFGTVPWQNYTVMQIADTAYQGASGLEHQSSHVDVVTPMAIGSSFQPSLYAHEIFHSWNVKRLRPADMWPYVYDRPMPTPWLWVSEGITDYYADLALVRGGVVDAAGFYGLTSAKIQEVNDTRPVALTDASLNTWVHPVDGTEYTYYPKGSLAGFMLDILIRDASNNRHSLDDVMRQLYQSAFEHARGFTPDDWWNALGQAAGGKIDASVASSFADFNARYVDGREPYPWDKLLPLAGLRVVAANEPRLGVYTQQEPNGGVRVAVVDSGSAAASAGVQPGDLLLAVGDISVSDQRFGDLFREKFANAREGSPLPIRVRRAGGDLTLQGKLVFAHNVRLEAQPGAPAKALRVREGILKGTTDR